MGFAYINGLKDTFRKSWSKRANRLKEPDLTTLKPDEFATVLVKPFDDFCPSLDDQYELQLNGKRIDVYLNRVPIGESLGVSSSLAGILTERGGKGIGSLHRTRPSSGLIDIAVWY